MIQVKLENTPQPQLFADTAQKAAQECCAVKGEVNKPSQLRRFYDELVMWDDKTTANKARFAEMLPFVQMMRAKVAYARGRKLVDDNFKDLFDGLIRQIDTMQKLRNARLFMEAFMGYLKYFCQLEEEKKNSNRDKNR